MEKIDVKVLKYIKKNANMDPEISDLVHHLKLKEDEIKDSLNRLLKEGQVNYQHPEEGRTYWYPVEEPEATAIMNRDQLKPSPAEQSLKTIKPVKQKKTKPAAVSPSVSSKTVIITAVMVILFTGIMACIISWIIASRSSQKFASKEEAAKIIETLENQKDFNDIAKRKIDSLFKVANGLSEENTELKKKVEDLEETFKKEIETRKKSKKRSRRRR